MEALPAWSERLLKDNSSYRYGSLWGIMWDLRRALFRGYVGKMSKMFIARALYRQRVPSLYSTLDSSGKQDMKRNGDVNSQGMLHATEQTEHQSSHNRTSEVSRGIESLGMQHRARRKEKLNVHHTLLIVYTIAAMTRVDGELMCHEYISPEACGTERAQAVDQLVESKNAVAAPSTIGMSSLGVCHSA